MAAVRFATLDDVSSLAHLNSEVQQLHASALPDVFKPPDISALAADFRLRILSDPQTRVLMVDVGGEPVAYVVMQVIERPEDAFAYARRWLHIDQISVKLSMQRQGFGGMLIDAVVELARAEGLTRITLDTWMFNQQAQAFYKKQNFEISKYRLEKFLA